MGYQHKSVYAMTCMEQIVHCMYSTSFGTGSLLLCMPSSRAHGLPGILLSDSHHTVGALGL